MPRWYRSKRSLIVLCKLTAIKFLIYKSQSSITMFCIGKSDCLENPQVEQMKMGNT